MMTHRTRREPPPFRGVAVVRTEEISPWMTRVVVGGHHLAGFTLTEPAASVRLLLPRGDRLEIPAWSGNEFRFADGSRPNIRSLTPRRHSDAHRELHLDVVHHDGGVLTPWTRRVVSEGGSQAAVSGPGRGYRIDRHAAGYHLLGDETAIPAICQLLEHLPDVPITVDIGVRHGDARVDLHRGVDERWHVFDSIDELGGRLVNALESRELGADHRVWAAGEAGAMRAVRDHLARRDVARDRASVRGYWKQR